MSLLTSHSHSSCVTLSPPSQPATDAVRIRAATVILA